MSELGKCQVKGCERQTVIRVIVSDGNDAGAFDLCQQHYEKAVQNAERQKRKRNKEGN